VADFGWLVRKLVRAFYDNILLGFFVEWHEGPFYNRAPSILVGRPTLADADSQGLSARSSPPNPPASACWPKSRHWPGPVRLAYAAGDGSRLAALPAEASPRRGPSDRARVPPPAGLMVNPNIVRPESSEQLQLDARLTEGSSGRLCPAQDSCGTTDPDSSIARAPRRPSFGRDRLVSPISHRSSPCSCWRSQQRRWPTPIRAIGTDWPGETSRGVLAAPENELRGRSALSIPSLIIKTD